MEDIAAHNRAFLDSHFPGLSVHLVAPHKISNFTFSTDPYPNILHGGKPLHARKNPGREALNLVKDIPTRPGIVVLFLGLGLGYQVQTYRERYPESFEASTVVVVERSAETFSLLCEHRDLSFLEGTYLFVGDAADEVQSLIERLSALDFTGYRIIRLRGGSSLYPGYYGRIEGIFREMLSGKISDLLTRFAFESLWVRNIVDNLPSLVGRQSIGALKGALSGKPVLVINAGPSLCEQLNLIRQVHHRVHLIAVDTVLTPLLKSGTVPDFVVTLDAGFYNALDFRWLFMQQADAAGMHLVADIVSHPLILRNWKGALSFSETSHRESSAVPQESTHLPLLDQFRQCYPSLHTLDCGGSISTTALELALFMDARPVYVTGLDLSYTGYKTHVNSTALFDELYRAAHRLSTLDSAMVRSILGRRRQYLPAIGGDSVLSDFVFMQYLRWLEARSAYRGTVVNCTARGARIKGLVHRSLWEVAGGTTLPRRKGDLEVGEADTLSQTEALGFLEALGSSIDRALEDIERHETPQSLAARYRAFSSLILEAQKLHGSTESLYRYLRLLLEFMKKHVHRSRSRILQT